MARNGRWIARAPYCNVILINLDSLAVPKPYNNRAAAHPCATIQSSGDMVATRRREQGTSQLKSLETEKPMRAGSTARHAMNKVKILFLAANPAATGQRTRELGVSTTAPAVTDPLQLDVEFREITAEIRASEYRDSLELDPDIGRPSWRRSASPLGASAAYRSLQWTRKFRRGDHCARQGRPASTGQ